MPRNVNVYEDAMYQRRLWTPCQLGGMASHWSARNLASMTFASGYASDIRSPCGFTMSQATGSKQAALSTFLGGPALYFDGFDDEYSFASFTAPWSMFVVNKSDEIVGDLDRFTYAGGPADYMPIAHRTDAGGTSIWRFNNVNYGTEIAAYVNGSQTPSLTNRTVAWTTFVTGQPLIASMLNMYTTSASGMIFGASTASSVYRMSGWWTDTVVIRGTVNDYLRTLVEGFLAWDPMRYNNKTLVNNLVSSHPFKNRPPLIGD